MEPKDQDMTLFRRQFQRYLADERTRFMARSQIIDDLIAQAMKATGCAPFVIPPQWYELIGALLKLGLDDVGLALFISTLDNVLHDTPHSAAATGTDSHAS